MHVLASSRRGKCLSLEYLNSHSKLKWECSKGHQWEAKPSNIKSGKWCPHCSGNVPLSIQEMKDLAKIKGGKCLSNIYLNSSTKLKWQCSKGHKWEATPSNIKKGKWCPYCIGKYQSIKDMHELAKTRNGKCLSSHYINNITKLEWECSKGHHWEARPSNITSGKWCPVCAGKQLLTIEEMKKIAILRGGHCLSNQYINAKTKLKWRCSKGHIWEATPNKIKIGSWCPYCIGMYQTIHDMYKLANSRNGECLSDEFIDAKTKLKWKCSEGHTWESTPDNIKSGSWCPYCAGKYQTIYDMHNLAKSRNGKCLSSHYTNNITKLKWECSEGHQWEARPANINSGKWCPTCAGKQLLTIEEMKAIAISRGGKCLSNDYINGKTKLKWQCSEGHIWEARPRTIKAGHWCNECNNTIGENICREYFQAIFKKPFPKSYPKWLISEKGSQLELDGFNEKLRIAFEHQGIQHYSYLKHFHKSERDFQRQIKIDELKRSLCKENGVVLIEIPQINKNISLIELPLYLTQEFKKQKLRSNANIANIKVNLSRIYNIDKLKAIIDIAENKGGKCLSEQYLGSNIKLLFECSEGHQWEATPDSIKAGKWCSKCAGNFRLSFSDMENLAKIRSGEILSKEYVNALSKLKWECSKGHQWEARPNDIKRGQWCPICARKKN